MLARTTKRSNSRPADSPCLPSRTIPVSSTVAADIRRLSALFIASSNDCRSGSAKKIAARVEVSMTMLVCQRVRPGSSYPTISSGVRESRTGNWSTRPRMSCSGLAIAFCRCCRWRRSSRSLKACRIAPVSDSPVLTATFLASRSVSILLILMAIGPRLHHYANK
jgi:hypothetical protein